MVLKACLRRPDCLSATTFDSLDQGTVAALNETFSRAVDAGASVVLLLSNRTDIPDWVTQFAAVEGGLMTVFSPGTPEQQRARWSERSVSRPSCSRAFPRTPSRSSLTPPTISGIKPLRGGVWRQAGAG